MKGKNRNCMVCVSSMPAWVLLFVVFMFGVQLSYASSIEKDGMSVTPQGVSIRGTVVDDTKTPIPGVSVIIQGTTKGTVTDINGNFELTAPVGGVLQISFIGFGKQEITVTSETSVLNIVLKEETENLEEVVIVGYGVQKKETVTGSLSSVSAEELVEQPVSDVTQALAGRLPGLIANQSGGRPGKDAATIKIRGISTLDAGAGSNPLVLIDGIERDQSALSFLDPNEIENLSILKDASSTAVFGVRGANGVILVTTKRGKVGPAKMVYKGSMSVLVPNKSIQVLDAYQQTGMLNEYNGYAMNSNDPTAPYPQSIRDKFKGVIDGNPLSPSDPFFYPSTDYAELMLKDYALQQQHNFTVSGGTERLKYFASLGYYDQGGMFENLNPDLDKSTSYKRYNYRTNLDINLTKSTLAKINIGGSFNENIALGQGNEPSKSFYWNLLVHSSPWDGYMHDGKLVMLQENANNVMLNSDMRGYNVQMENTNDYTFIIDQKLDFITEGLSAKAKVSLVSYFSNYISRQKNQERLAYWNPYLNEDETVTFYQVKEDVLPYNSTWQGKNRKEYYEFALNYKRTFKEDHTVTALALFNAEKSHFSQSTYNEIPRAYMGLVGRVTYNYMNRYMLEFNIGYNGSENFAEGQRFGYFPAYSGGWTFSEEPWLKSLIGEDILSYGKLRFSYGTVGNDKMSGSRFLYLPDSYSLNQGGRFGIYFGLPGEMVSYPIALPGDAGNPNVTWEKATKINYGADMTFFGDILSLKLDYFTEDRTDILITQQVVPVYQQTGDLALNLGHVENKGYEIELGWNKNVGNNTRINVDLNYTHSRNKIIEMDEPEQPYDYRAQTGKRVGEVWGYQQEDFFRTAEEANAYRDELWKTYNSINPGADKDSYQAYQIFTTGSDVSAGDLKFIDRNGDGIITDMDAGYLGTPSFPETMYGIRAGITHKKVSFSVFLQGASDYAINIRTDNSPDPTKGSLLDFVEYRYTDERYAAGDRVEFPRLTSDNNNWKYAGSYWLRDASYLRLKNVELGYTFDRSNRFVKTLGLESFRVYANGMNLVTFSAIDYLDPETSNGTLTYPRSRVFNLGVQIQF